MHTATFFAQHPVFSLEQAVRDLAPPGGRSGMVARLAHHLATGRLLNLARGVYAVVPLGADPATHRPDPLLVAAAGREDAVLAYHAALELLGAAHSLWRDCAAFTSRPRRPIVVDGATIRFHPTPPAMVRASGVQLGTRWIERKGILVEVTGPERTLVEGLRRPRLVGGLEELVRSAAGFPSLDIGLLGAVLDAYATAHLWASVGWFLARVRHDLGVPEDFLERCACEAPKAAQYMQRGQRGGTLQRRWNLIVPPELERLGEPDER